jgi:uncharacterized repeat protein (TIGR01451 family)
MKTSMSRAMRAAAAVAALTVAVVPLAAVTAAASQGGSDDHKVTLCHRTNSENNPYVVITIDKAGVFKTGHDGHDEGGVYQAGDKANGVRWGDIIPAFDYYASPQDEKAGTKSQYPGLNNTAEGTAILENGCQVPGGSESPEPGGALSGECTDAGAFVVSGDTDADGSTATFRLNIGGISFVPVSGPFEQTVDAPAGTVVTLEYRLGDGGWTSTGETVTVKDCAGTENPPAHPAGSFTVVCTSTGALVDIGTLDADGASGGRFELVVAGPAQTVSSGQQDIVVGSQAALVLRYVPAQGAATVLQQGTAPAACPTTTTPPPPSPERGLTVTKAVTPTGSASVGDTLTYTLAVTTTGNAAQSGVTVTDYLPGYAPGTTSGATTYVSGSASCAGSGTCTTAYDASTHQVTWGLGTMAAGSTRTVSFQVVIDAPADGTAPADVVNAGTVRSDQVGPTPSNPVVTPVVAVEGTKTGSKGTGSAGSGRPGTDVQAEQGGTLPHTGPGTALARLLGAAALLLLAGAGLLRLAEEPRR